MKLINILLKEYIKPEFFRALSGEQLVNLWNATKPRFLAEVKIGSVSKDYNIGVK